MPRKPKFTKEEVLNSAFQVAKRQGFEAITAASVADNMGYTGSSLFTHFESMDEIRREIYRMAKQQAMDFFRGSINYFPAFKELGLRWIRFAKSEPNLYRMVFAGNPFTHTEDTVTEFEEIFAPIRKEVEKAFDLSADMANRLMSACITQANGIALAIINGFGENYTDERLSEELSNICIGMVLLCKVKDESLTIESAKRIASATANMPVRKRRDIIKKERIVTERLTLSPYRKEDRERLVEMMQNPEITATFMVPDYPETSQFYTLADKLIAFSQIKDTTHLEYGIYLDGYMIGFVNDCGYDNEAIEIGYVIDPAYKGQGYATEAVGAVIKEFKEMGFKKVIAGYFEGNIGSRRVMEKCGMRPNGNVEEEEYRGKTLVCYECEVDL